MNAAALLAAWEEGQGQGPAHRALSLLAAADPEAGWEELAALPLGERDRRLLDLRQAALGGRLDGVARCPGCGETLDVALDSRSLRVEAVAGPELALSRAGLELRFRLPDSRDLLAAEACAGVAEARRTLAERCVVEAWRGGAPVAAAALADEEVAALADALAAADPGAELLLELSCPVCGHGWSAILDVASFVWSEVEAEALRLLGEVHVLARAYGWREGDVLALSPRRRRLYLGMVAG